MYCYAGCRHPIQRVTGDAYDKYFSIGRFFEGRKEKQKEYTAWSKKENKQILQLLTEGHRATAIAKIMKIKFLRVKGKIEYIRKQQRFAGETVFERSPNSNNRKCIQQFTIEGKLLTEYESTYAATRQTKIDRTNICKTVHHHRRMAGGYIWRYA